MLTRFYPLATSLLLASLVSSCQSRSQSDEIVCQTYVHRYGVPLESNDWKARGKHGQIVSVRKDGVTVTKTYDSGVLNGECTYTFPHRDTVERRELYLNGELSEKTLHYSSGMPMQKFVYQGPSSFCTNWYENGSPQANEQLFQGKIVNGEYYSLNNQVESKVEEGKGLRVRRNDHGVVEFVDTIENGQMVQRSTYHINGAPSSATRYLQGQAHGERRTFLPGGEPVTVENWVNGTQHGLTTEYAYGEKVAEVPYVKGQKHGIEKRYKENGQVLVQETTWNQGTKQGPCHLYYGKNKQTDWYFNNARVNKPTYDMLLNQ